VSDNWESQARQWWDKAGCTVYLTAGAGPTANHTTRSALIVASDCLAEAVAAHLAADHQIQATIDMVRYDPAIPDSAEVLALSTQIAGHRVLIPMLPGHTTLRAYPPAPPGAPLGDAIQVIPVLPPEQRSTDWVPAEAIAAAIAASARSN
jgi:hypothetical protein